MSYLYPTKSEIEMLNRTYERRERLINYKRRFDESKDSEFVRKELRIARSRYESAFDRWLERNFHTSQSRILLEGD